MCKNMRLRSPRGSGRKGFSLVEVSIAMTLMAVIGYSFVAASDMGNSSFSAVELATAKGRELRAAGGSLVEEFQVSNPDTVDIVVLGNGYPQVTFQQPLIVNGALLWGAYNPLWGSDADDRNKADWWIRYTVVNTAAAGEDGNMTLMRQVLDENDDLIEQDEVVSHLSSSFAANPGFSVVATGDVWEIQVNTEGYGEGDGGNGGTYNVRMRN